jgi:hypothetical protein
MAKLGFAPPAATLPPGGKIRKSVGYGAEYPHSVRNSKAAGNVTGSIPCVSWRNIQKRPQNVEAVQPAFSAECSAHAAAP